MNTQTTILIKTDKKVKEAARKVAHDIGIPLSTLINAYLRQVATERRVTFVSPKKLHAATRRAIENADAGRNLTAYDSADDLFADVFGDHWRGAL